MTSLRTLLAKNIKKRRKFLGISQAKLAEKASTSTHYISQIELKNRFPTPEMLERIAKALEIDSPQLFSTEMNYDEAIKRFQDLFLAEIGATAKKAAEARLGKQRKK